MHGSVVVGWLLTVLMGATGLYCLARLLRRRATGAERQLDASEALKGLGMAAMALPYGLGRGVPVALWVGLFGAAAVWSVAAGLRPSGSGGPADGHGPGRAQAQAPGQGRPESHRGHHLYHGVGHLAMVYMALAMAAGAAGVTGPAGGGGAARAAAGMAGMSGMAGSTGVPLLTGGLLLFFGTYALVGGVRLVGGAGSVGRGSGSGTVAGRLLGAPELPQACRMTLGLGMFTMLLVM